MASTGVRRDSGRVLTDSFAARSRGAPMHWIEDFLGFSPDAGSGLTELLIALALVVLIVAACIGMNAFGARTALRRILRRNLRD
jgi:hypothetical protein